MTDFGVCFDEIRDVLELVVAEMEEAGTFVARLLAGVSLAKVNSAMIPGMGRFDRGQMDKNKISMVIENRAPIKVLPSRENVLLKPGRLRDFLDFTFGRKDGTPGLYGPQSASRKIYEPYVVQRSAEFLATHGLDEVDGKGVLIYAKSQKVTLNLCAMGIARERAAECVTQLDNTRRGLGCGCTPACGAEQFSRGKNASGKQFRHANNPRGDAAVKLMKAREEECKLWDAAMRLSEYGWAIDDVSVRMIAPLLELIPNLGGIRL